MVNSIPYGILQRREGHVTFGLLPSFRLGEWDHVHTGWDHAYWVAVEWDHVRTEWVHRRLTTGWLDERGSQPVSTTSVLPVLSCWRGGGASWAPDHL